MIKDVAMYLGGSFVSLIFIYIFIRIIFKGIFESFFEAKFKIRKNNKSKGEK
jgi:hypothetical protein